MVKSTIRIISCFLLACFMSCSAYRQDILFQLSEDGSVVSQSVYDTERNYTLQPNDLIEINLFTNGGEQLIDLNAQVLGQSANNQFNQNRQRFTYLVQRDGILKLPMIGDHYVSGLTIDQAEEKLETAYDEFFKDSFLKIQFANKRVVVIGALNAVVPLENDNTSLFEVIALAGGVEFGQMMQNVRVLRGDLSQPEVFSVDLTSIEGMKSSMVSIMPGDVVYIEPWRREWLQVMRDIAPVIGVTSSISTLIFLLINSTNN